MMLLSREQERMRSGLSSGQAMAVTQPACPLSVPLNTSVSAMIVPHVQALFSPPILLSSSSSSSSSTSSSSGAGEATKETAMPSQQSRRNDARKQRWRSRADTKADGSQSRVYPNPKRRGFYWVIKIFKTKCIINWKLYPFQFSSLGLTQF